MKRIALFVFTVVTTACPSDTTCNSNADCLAGEECVVSTAGNACEPIGEGEGEGEAEGEGEGFPLPIQVQLTGSGVATLHVVQRSSDELFCVDGIPSEPAAIASSCSNGMDCTLGTCPSVDGRRPDWDVSGDTSEGDPSWLGNEFSSDVLVESLPDGEYLIGALVEMPAAAGHTVRIWLGGSLATEIDVPPESIGWQEVARLVIDNPSVCVDEIGGDDSC